MGLAVWVLTVGRVVRDAVETPRTDAAFAPTTAIAIAIKIRTFLAIIDILKLLIGFIQAENNNVVVNHLDINAFYTTILRAIKGDKMADTKEKTIQEPKKYTKNQITKMVNMCYRPCSTAFCEHREPAPWYRDCGVNSKLFQMVGGVCYYAMALPWSDERWCGFYPYAQDKTNDKLKTLTWLNLKTTKTK